MARKELDYSAKFGRDAGKQFRITEMSARRGYDWATRVMFALLNSGVEMDEDIAERGLAGLASVAMSMLGKIPASMAKPLMDELLDCVKIVFKDASRALIEDDIEEFVTIFELQKAVFMLHVQPFISGGPLTSGSAPTAQ
jgi:hypothetical protein